MNGVTTVLLSPT